MKLYIAGIYTSNFKIGGSLYNRLTDGEKALRHSVSSVLESYHYIGRQSYVDALRTDKQRVFLDSGAFSAFTKGVEVDLPAYCEYVKRNIDIIEHVDGIPLASVLDGIGDPLKTWQNQQAMERLGVRPLPCFHYGEDERYLEWYLANYDYITLGGMVPISTKDLLIWLDRIWDKYLTDGSGRPRIRVHGFGLTAYVLMQRYPWFSVDSSSWVQQAANGNIVLTDYRIGSVIYLPVSDKSPTRRQDGRHIDTMTEIERELLWEHAKKAGSDIERLKAEYVSRWCYNIASYDKLGKILTDLTKTFKADQQDLFQGLL